MPTLDDRAREFDVASITVRQALQLLKQEGLISPEQGRGTFVRAKPPTHPRMQVETSLKKLADRDHGVVLPLARMDAAQVAVPGRGQPVAGLEARRRGAFLERDEARIVPAIQIIPVLIDLPAVKIASARQTLTIGTAGAATAQALNISVNAPVAEIRRVFCAPDGTVIYLGELAYRGDFIRLDIDLLS